MPGVVAGLRGSVRGWVGSIKEVVRFYLFSRVSAASHLFPPDASIRSRFREMVHNQLLYRPCSFLQA